MKLSTNGRRYVAKKQKDADPQVLSRVYLGKFKSLRALHSLPSPSGVVVEATGAVVAAAGALVAGTGAMIAATGAVVEATGAVVAATGAVVAGNTGAGVATAGSEELHRGRETREARFS